MEKEEPRVGSTREVVGGQCALVIRAAAALIEAATASAAQAMWRASQVVFQRAALHRRRFHFLPALSSASRRRRLRVDLRSRSAAAVGVSGATYVAACFGGSSITPLSVDTGDFLCPAR